MKENNKSRRTFILSGLLSSLTAFAAMMLYPVWRFIMPPKVPESTQNAVKAAKVNELEPNSGKVFPFGSKPAILIRLASGEYRAFTAVCTHLQCTVQYRKDFKLIWCACHNGRFDTNGNVVAGPPPSSLEPFKVAISGSDIIVSKRA